MTLWKWASSPEEEGSSGGGGGGGSGGGTRVPAGTLRVDARQLEEALSSWAKTAPEPTGPKNKPSVLRTPLRRAGRLRCLIVSRLSPLRLPALKVNRKRERAEPLPRQLSIKSGQSK